MTTLPAPPVTADCDCTDLDGFMLNVERLMASELVALSSHEVVGAALFLWCRAWKQMPAASLPDDERVLAAYARLPLLRFRKLRSEVMRGFVKCSDGRLYHRFLAKEAAAAYERKVAFRKKRETDAERLRNWRGNKGETTPETSQETIRETRFVAEGQGQGQGQKANHQAPQPDPAAAQAGRAKRFEPIDDGGDDDFRRAERACIAALGGSTLAGGHAPADPAFGPVMLLIDNGFSIDKIVTVLRSEAQRPRRKPIRTWALWAEILAERLADAARLAPAQGAPGADEPRVDFGGGYSASLSSIRLMRDRGAWPDQWGPPLGKPGCRVPTELAAQLAEAVP